MIISHEKKFIYFCNGKTGTRSMEYVLKKYDDNSCHPILWKIAENIRNYIGANHTGLVKKRNLGSGLLPQFLLLPYKNQLEFRLPLCPEEHVPPLIVKKRMGEDVYEKYFTFVFVRNPWSWVLSCYLFNAKADRQKFTQFRQEHFFEHWENMKNYRAVFEFENYFQHNYVYDYNGKKIVDFVGKYENMDNDYATICDKIDIPKCKLPLRNEGVVKDYRSYYCKETIDLVAQYYKKDIELFEYEY